MTASMLDRSLGRSYAEHARYRRARRRRGVSPIIATILLVAITVVLAAVLYVLISGLSHGPGSTPIGSAFAISTPTASTCTAAGVTAKTCATAGDQIFTFTIAQSTITLGSVEFALKTSSGGAFTNSLVGSFAIETAVGAEVASYSEATGPGFAMLSSWTHYAGTNSAGTPITTTMSLVIDTGTAATSWTPGQGNIVSALGVGSYSGATTPVTLP